LSSSGVLIYWYSWVVAFKKQMSNTHKEKSETRLLLLERTGTTLLIVLAVLFVGGLLLKVVDSWKAIDKNSQTKPSLQSNFEQLPGWSTYTNREYGFSISIPLYTQKFETKGVGGYDQFIKFIKSDISGGESIFVGIKQGSIDYEVQLTTTQFKSEYSIEPDYSSKEIIGDLQAHVLLYSTVSEALEKRGFVFFEKNGYVYSFSTTPEQVQIILQSFKFTK
jgi:hypothetical protein